MEKKLIIKVDGMKCDNCASHVKNAIESISNVNSVSVNLKNKEVTIRYINEIDKSLVNEKVEEEGYKII